MIKVLINAYACSPNMGSEPGMAWNWCVNLAEYCELHIITEGEFKDKIEVAVLSLPQGKNMHFYYNPLSEEIREMCWNQGDWRFYKHYKKWQFSTYLKAVEIVKNNKIDILHQLNMIGFREPGYLWKIKNIPLIWGPVDAKRNFPVSYLENADFKTKLFINLKNVITYFQLKHSRRVKQAVTVASKVVSASSNSQETFRTFYNINSPLLNETGCYVQENEVIDKTDKKILDILWVGKFDFRKQLSVAIETISTLNDVDIILHIIGGGNDLEYKELAKSLGVENQCKWYGVISHHKVQQMMLNSDLFFFTSVAEGTPHVVLEAISNNLPILCFNTCGQGDIVNDTIGKKIELSTPKKSVLQFSSIIKDLNSNREKLYDMSINCKKQQMLSSWQEKAKSMVNIYKSCLS